MALPSPYCLSLKPEGRRDRLLPGLPATKASRKRTQEDARSDRGATRLPCRCASLEGSKAPRSRKIPPSFVHVQLVPTQPDTRGNEKHSGGRVSSFCTANATDRPLVTAPKTKNGFRKRSSSIAMWRRQRWDNQNAISETNRDRNADRQRPRIHRMRERDA
jgi:hypothetical protein